LSPRLADCGRYHQRNVVIVRRIILKTHHGGE
jgi:hypothetical protein